MCKALENYSVEVRPRGCARPSITPEYAALQLVRAYKMVVSKYRHCIPEFQDVKLQVSVQAPETLKGLEADLAEGKVRVSPEHSAHSLYGDVGNLWFRWMHDMGHLHTKQRMHHEGEVRLATVQYNDVAMALHTLGMKDKDVGFCLALYLADSAGQSDYLDKHGEFPEDQRTFVLNTVKAWGWEVLSVH